METFGMEKRQRKSGAKAAMRLTSFRASERASLDSSGPHYPFYDQPSRSGERLAIKEYFGDRSNISICGDGKFRGSECAWSCGSLILVLPFSSFQALLFERCGKRIMNEFLLFGWTVSVCRLGLTASAVSFPSLWLVGDQLWQIYVLVFLGLG